MAEHEGSMVWRAAMAEQEGSMEADAAVKARTKDVDSPKLFFGQLPRSMTESEFKAFCEEMGPVFDVALLRDKKADADLAIATWHMKHTMSNMQRPLQVKVADSEKVNDENRKLFVGMIGKTTIEDELRQLFAPYGQVEDVAVLRHPDGNGRGCGFVKFAKLQEAHAAISALHNSTTFPGCNAPIVVKLADTDRDKLQKRAHQTPYYPPPPQYQQPFYQQQPSYPQQSSYQQQSSYPQQQQSSYDQQLPYQQGAGTGASNPGGVPLNSAMMGLLNPLVMAAIMPQMAAMMGMDPAAAAASLQGAAMAGAAPSTVPMYQPPSTDTSTGMPAGFGAGTGGGAQGPEGANLFIYHLPNEWTDADLFSAFSVYGNVISAKVYMDRNTGLSKCFGFVSYDNVGSASIAIQSMNGYQVGTKRLKVQVKTARNAARPY